MPDPSIKDPSYIERPEAEELDLVTRIHGRFKGTGLVMPERQRKMYEAITLRLAHDIGANPHYPKFAYKKTAVDVGCGAGIGTNLLGRESKFAWGIDLNTESINYAKQMFERMPSNLYTSPQISFDVVDIKNFPREVMKFDYVVCLEVIEHLDDWKKVLTFLDRLTGPATTVLISSPNRNAPELGHTTPTNEHHVREWTAGEFYDVLTAHYKTVTLWKHDLSERVDLDTTTSPILAECKEPL